MCDVFKRRTTSNSGSPGSGLLNSRTNVGASPAAAPVCSSTAVPSAGLESHTVRNLLKLRRSTVLGDRMPQPHLGMAQLVPHGIRLLQRLKCGAAACAASCTSHRARESVAGTDRPMHLATDRRTGWDAHCAAHPASFLPPHSSSQTCAASGWCPSL